MPRYDVAVRNGYGNNVSLFQNDFSIQEIAQKIIDNPKYYDKLVNGIPQVANKKICNGFHLIITENSRVFKGVKLGALYGGYYRSFYTKDHRDIESIEATCDGIFIPDLGKLHRSNNGFYVCDDGLPIEFGKIYLPEFEFFKRNQQRIEQEVKNIPLRKKQEAEQRERQKQQAIELKKQQEEEKKWLEAEKKRLEEEAEKEAERKRIEDLLNEQTKNIEKLDELLKELDKYIQMGQEISIETLQNIKDKLKVLYSQKDNLKDKKTINDLKSYFETSYKVAKTNPKLDEIIEERMLVILRTFFEILDAPKDRIDTKISEIKSAGNDKKFEVEFTKIIQELNNKIAQVQNSVEKKVLIDFSDLKNIENSLDYLSSKKEKVSSSKYLENCKTSFELLFEDYRKLEICSENATKSMCIILNKFYDLLDFSNEQKLKIIEARQKTDEEREFANKVSEQNETIKSLSAKIREFEVIVENNEPVKIELLQTLEDLIKELVKQKNIIQNKTEIENIKVHFDAIFKDCKKKKDFSNSASLRMQEIEKSFDDILGKKKGFWARIFGK